MVLSLSGGDSFAPLERFLAKFVMATALLLGVATAAAVGAGHWMVGLEVGLAAMALGAWLGDFEVKRLRCGRDCWAASLLELSFLVAMADGSRQGEDARVSRLSAPERVAVWLLSGSLRRNRQTAARQAGLPVEQTAPGAPATLAEMRQCEAATLDLSASVTRVVARLSEARVQVDRSARAADQVVVRLFAAVAEGRSGEAGAGQRFCRTQGVTQLSGQAALAAE